MLMSEKLTNTELLVPRPVRTAFPDGRMATKEAWNYCKLLCEKRKLEVPTLRTFKWHLKHGNFIYSDQVPNPFGGSGPDKVYAISCEAVVAFVDELEKRPGELHLADDDSSITVDNLPPKQLGPKFEVDLPPQILEFPSSMAVHVKKALIELTSKEAFAYICRQAKRGFFQDPVTFDLYLTYDVIPSRRLGGHHLVQVVDLDAFLELAPDGIYANHIEHHVAAVRGRGDFSMKEAYDFYSGFDPNPIPIHVFRSVVTAGIIPAIRTANNPKAPVVGFKKQDILGFLALRQRLQEKIAVVPTTAKPSQERQQTVAKMVAAAIEKVDPKIKAELEQVSSKKPQEKVSPPPQPVLQVPKETQVQETPEIKVPEVKVPQAPKAKPEPIEKAYHMFNQLIPPGVSMIQFKRLVNTGLVHSFTRDSVVYVHRAAVEEYFVGLAEVDKKKDLQMGPAYEYYCSQCKNPVHKTQFSRLVTQGDIEGGYKGEEGVWMVSMIKIDEFIELNLQEDPDPVEPSTIEDPPQGSMGSISLSMSDYASPIEMKKTLDMLTSQGFKVVVKP